MPWCPKCKNEYKEGIETCSDCGCELVKDEPLEDVTLSDVETALQEMSDEEKAAFKETLKQVVEEAETAERNRPVAPYQNSAAKAEDNKASAYMLLIFGVLGMVVVILGISGVLPIYLSGAGKYMAYGIMSALFLLFIVMGLVSMKSYRIFAKKAESENTLRSTIEKWCKENLTAESIDKVLFAEKQDVDGTNSDGEDTQPAKGEDADQEADDTEDVSADISEEEKYFKRTSYMKEKITEKFLNLDEAFLDNFVDEMYTNIYGE
ncbi:MAG: hypothetical protein J6B90_10875 [Lachnospiraceae bacterium]|nr:hypothetical protein [Lachnospiraceae bacterium]